MYKRLSLSFFLLMLIVFLIGISFVKIQTRAREQAAYQNLESIAKLKVEQLESWLHEIKIDGEVLKGSLSLSLRIEQFIKDRGCKKFCVN